MATLKQRTTAATSQQPPETPNVDAAADQQKITPPSPQPLEIKQRRSATSLVLASTGNLANLLPTGTLLAFQLLTPIFTNGSCDTVTRALTAALFVFLAASCFLASFTDSFRSPKDGHVYYGLATFKGMWLFDYVPSAAGPVDQLAQYKLRFIDWVHAVLSVLVFGVVAMRDRNLVGCFYPQPSLEAKEVLDILPIGVGFICSLLFVAFPTKRHGLGYPVTAGDKSS